MQYRGRSTDEWGNVLFDSEGLVDLLMHGSELSGDLTALNSDGVVKFNDLCREFDHPDDAVSIYTPPTISVEDWDAEHQKQWFVPEPYASLDVLDWLAAKCETDEQLSRIAAEWVLFEERDMVPVLRCLIYLVDSFRERGIVWGVGRGSSVASYALYLIGVHRVDSLAFDLDVREFLK
jgi:DNA polymerase III alpha subunit